MTANVGSIDRILRIILGVVIIAVGFYFQSWWGLIGIIPLATAFMKWCPAYLPFGISTCKTDPAKK
jgi:sulfite exporter TauE/SafE